MGGWSDSPSGEWNSLENAVDGMRRIPIDGLTNVNQDPAPNPAAIESAAGKAIALVPPSLDVTQPVGVLLHLHGFKVGYRQRSTTTSNPGTVRDVLVDQIAGQVAQAVATGQTIVGLLP